MTKAEDGEPHAWVLPARFAHRGLYLGDEASLPDENSLDAFLRCAVSGVGCELDVRLARDGTPVVIHDPAVRGRDGRRVRVADSSADELALLGIPTLLGALQLLAGRPVMIELKQSSPRVGALESETLHVIRESGRTADDTIVASFNPWTVAWFARNVPSLPRALTVGRLAWRTVLSSMVLRAVKPDVLSVRLDLVGSRRVRRVCSGFPIVGWTARGPSEVARVSVDVDSVIFEGSVA